MNRKMLAVILPVLVALLLVGLFLRGRRAPAEPEKDVAEEQTTASTPGDESLTQDLSGGEMLDRKVLAKLVEGTTYRVERYDDPNKGAIAGHVLDRTGRGLTGVAVEILPTSSVNQPTYYYSTTKVFTDKNGYFIFHNIEPQNYLFICGQVRETLPLKPGTMIIRDVQFKGAASITGHVQDGSGRRVFPAVVYLVSPRFRLVSLTNENGVFDLQSIPADNFQVAARSEGFIPSEYKEVQLKEADRVTDVVFTLNSGANLEGTVKNEKKDPVPGVRISSAPTSGRIGTSSGVTDAKGHFEITGLPAGAQQLMLIMDGSYERPGPTVNVELGKDNYVDIVLKSGARISGVVGVEGGEPVPEDLVAVVQMGGNAGGKDQYFRRSIDSNGRFTLENLEDGEYRIFVSSAANERKLLMPEPKAVKVTEGSDQTVSFYLEKGGLVTGQVTDRSGKPIQRARVVVTCRNKQNKVNSIALNSDDKGFFQSPYLAAGMVSLEASAQGFLACKKDNVPLASGNTLNIGLIMDCGGSLEGLVLDAKGRPRAGVIVYIRPVGDASFANLPRTVTAADGRYSFANLTEGNYLAYILWPNPKSGNRMQTLSQQVRINANQKSRSDFRLPSP